MGYAEEALNDAVCRTNRNNRLRGKAFERRVVGVFRGGGFNCRRTPFSGASVTYGKGDVEFLDGSPLFVECKSYKEDLIASTRLIDTINKAYDQSRTKRCCIVVRDTKGINRILIEKTDVDLMCPAGQIYWKIDVDSVEFFVLPLDVGVRVLAHAYGKLPDRRGSDTGATSGRQEGL